GFCRGQSFICDTRRRVPPATYPGACVGHTCGPIRRRIRLLPYLVLLRAGFAVPPSVATGAVRSYRTISPLPPPLQGGWRFAFCCTFRGLAPPRRYLAPCPGSPDFPPRLRAAIAWPTPRVMVGAIGRRSKLFAEAQRGFVQVAALEAGDMRRDLRRLRWRQLFQQGAQQRVAVELERGARRRRAAHDDHDLAARHVAVALGSVAQLRERAGVRRFEALRQLATDGSIAFCAEYSRHVAQHFRETMRRFVEDQRAFITSELREALAARRGFRRQKAFENEAIGRQAGDRQGGNRCARAWNCNHRDACTARGGDQVEARIAHQRRAGVAHQRDRFASCKSCNELRALLCLV